jgi:hypothetical protein
LGNHSGPDIESAAGQDEVETMDAEGEAREAFRGRMLALATAAVVVAGVALRVAAARGPLWLDEIWSILLARYGRSLAGVLTLHHDNNHHLNTVWLLLVGPGRSPLLYRTPAVLAGAGMVLWATLRPLRRGGLDRLVTAALLSGSYLMVHYGSEARGYSLAMFFGLGAYQALDLYLAQRRARWAAAFAVLASLGILSHLTIAFVLAGAFGWAALELRGDRVEKPPQRSALLLPLPLLVLGVLWLVDLRYLQIGRGPAYDIPSVLRELLRAAHGLPPGPLELAAVLTLAAAGYEAAALARARDRRLVFFALAMGAPAAALAWRRPEVLAPRYFVVLVPFLFLLAAAGAARAARSAVAGRVAVAGALVAFLFANALACLRLIELGRGSYPDAVRRMVAATPAGLVTVGGDHDWRTLAVLQYFTARLGVRDRVVFVPADKWSPAAPEWLLNHDFALPPAAPPVVRGRNGRDYDLVAVFPYAGLSGWNWLLYRMAPAPAGSAPAPERARP